MPLVNLGCRSSILLIVALLLSGCSQYISPQASKEFNARADPFSVSVYPVNVIRPPGTIQPNIRLAEKVVTFLKTEELAKPVLVKELGRPVGVITDSEGVLLVADDVGNIIWRVAPDTRAN